MKAKHFVIIKFNYPEGYPLLDTKKQFLKWICMDSLRKQTNKDFIPVIISDVPLSSEGFGEFIISLNWKDKVKEMIKGYDYVITTRLDSDDFVTPDFIQTIRDNFEEKDKLVIQLDGYVYDVRTKKLIDNTLFRKLTSSILSFVEKADGAEFCYVGEHGKMCKLYQTKWVNEKSSVWCINDGSIQSITRNPEYFSKGMKEYKREIFKDKLDLVDKLNELFTKKTNELFITLDRLDLKTDPNNFIIPKKLIKKEVNKYEKVIC